MESNGELVKFLGEGAYGAVHLVRYILSDGSFYHVAVKGSSPTNRDSLNRELKILRELRGCPRIVTCFGDSLEEGLGYDRRKVYNLILEYAPEGSLSDFMDGYIDRKLPEPLIKDFTRMILEGLVSIHGHGYVHCDIKPDNLLVFPSGGDDDDSYELKISDFGVTLEVGDTPDYWSIYSPFVGSPRYMPPESVENGVVKETLDLWSLGCLVLEMYTGERPWEGIDNDRIEALLLGGKAPEIPESVPCDAREFIQTCFARNPEERGSAFKLWFHRFLLLRPPKEDKVIAVAAAGEKRDSLPLRIRGAWKDITKKPLKAKIFPSKPPKSKKILNSLLGCLG
ncbi:Protein kinase superfamily protein [Raphanus sativus]|uniref:Mitogen-activated protein kinase kinase kinase 20-like n=1 Tax=Raphanus sativus TaxID=3726 RepID=A0A9W3C8V6_RAPSA|nr:mitogen-activated protein kinase kinase kinase 20-like [Raphanus sativus]KAJ4881074.1 Protein kinase superfamily protein [Raphanus sativus]